MNITFKIDGKTLETYRLILRTFNYDDLNDLFEYASVEGVGEKAGWKHHESILKSKEILDIFIKHDKTFAIVLKENNKVIGSIGVDEYGMEDKLTEFNNYKGREIGFVLNKDYWGKGIMTEAVKEVINYLFNDLELDFLLCGYYDFNTTSKRVQEKLGFKPYRKIVMETSMGTKENGILNLLINPNKMIRFNFSHPETLIYKEENTMNEEIKKYLEKYNDEIKDMFYKLRELIFECGSYEVEEQMWAKLPTYYVDKRFVRLIPFKDHINVEAKYMASYIDKLSDYKITPKGMLQLYLNQNIPFEVLKEVFKKTLMGE